MMKQGGKLIVIDGADSTGKKTQAELLRARMEREGLPVRAFSFPRYENLSSAAVWLYLERHEGDAFSLHDREKALADIGAAYDRGDRAFRERLMQILAQITSSPWGNLAKDPYTPPLFFAVDRAAARQEMRECLENGTHIVSDRYVSANLIHQGGKIGDASARKLFWTRMRELEYEWLQLPKPDINFLLLLDPKLSERFQKEKFSSLLVPRKPDAHERDRAHQQNTYRACVEIAATFPKDFSLIHCNEGEHALRPEKVHALIWDTARPLLEI